MLGIILSMYYSQLFIGFICGAGIALCLTYLNKENNMNKNA